MRDRDLALACLRLAHDQTDPRDVLERAEAYYGFVTGDDSADKLAEVVRIVSPSG